jgi:hypothetical protein
MGKNGRPWQSDLNPSGLIPEGDHVEMTRQLLRI